MAEVCILPTAGTANLGVKRTTTLSTGLLNECYVTGDDSRLMTFQVRLYIAIFRGCFSNVWN